MVGQTGPRYIVCSIAASRSTPLFRSCQDNCCLPSRLSTASAPVWAVTVSRLLVFGSFLLGLPAGFRKERRKKIPETNMETAFLKQHPAVCPVSKHHCSTILLKPKFTANDFRRRHVLSVHISDIKPCVQEQMLVRRIHKKKT